MFKSFVMVSILWTNPHSILIIRWMKVWDLVYGSIDCSGKIALAWPAFHSFWRPRSNSFLPFITHIRCLVFIILFCLFSSTVFDYNFGGGNLVFFIWFLVLCVIQKFIKLWDEVNRSMCCCSLMWLQWFFCCIYFVVNKKKRVYPMQKSPTFDGFGRGYW